MANIADSFVSVKGAERRRIKRKSKKMGRRKIVAKMEKSKINYGEHRDIKTLKSRERRDSAVASNFFARGKDSYFRPPGCSCRLYIIYQ